MPDDVSINTFHVFTPTSPVGFNDIKDPWVAFMNAISSIFPEQVAATGHLFRIYDLADPEPRAPVHDSTWDFSSTPTGESLPSEIALCISFKADPESGVEPARRRGRLYFGPLDVNGNSDNRPTGFGLQGLVDAFVDFQEDLDLNSVQFGVWSRVDSTFYRTPNVWTDNAWDVQRRRGTAATERFTGTATV